jgi:hypothetical protein
MDKLLQLALLVQMGANLNSLGVSLLLHWVVVVVLVQASPTQDKMAVVAVVGLLVVQAARLREVIRTPVAVVLLVHRTSAPAVAVVLVRLRLVRTAVARQAATAEPA